jgi:carboxypeptidase Taq
MGVHESQSRFFENVIGRSEAFWVPLYEKLQAAFPGQLDAVSREDFVAAMNYSKPGLIRTEADELTYSLHVLIRYEIEKMIFADQVTVEELPALWNQKISGILRINTIP